jgi:transposase
MMAALIAGERDPKVLAQLTRARKRAKISQLEEAFVGRFSDHHAFLLTKMLARIDAVDADIAEVETRIEEQIAPFAEAVARLDTMPGVGVTTANVIIAEVGLDMTRFPTAAQLASCASFVSAGRRVLHLRRVAGGVPGTDTRPWPRKSPSAASPTALVRWR